MPYSTTIWINDQAPAINAANLNKLEQGVATAQSIAEAADATFTHIQSSAAAAWTVSHNLGKRPSVTVIDSAGREVVGDVTHLSLNSVRLDFGGAFSGEVTFN